MTCVVIASNNRTVVVAADSAGTRDTELRLRADRKVFTTGPYAIGFTRSYRMGQILRYCTELPEPPAGEDDLNHFMVTDFIPVVRSALVQQGFPGTDDRHGGGLFSVGVRGQIFEIREDYQVGRPAQPYSAIGTGALVALGALHTLHAQDSPPPLRELVLAALEASESFCTVVRRPFHVVETPNCSQRPGNTAGEQR